MEKNDFLLYNEVVYRIHACQTLQELKPTILSQVNLLIPYSYASFISVREDPETRELIHSDPYCKPARFEAAERAWLNQLMDQSYTIWLSHAAESVVIRDSEIIGEGRFSTPTYRDLYLDYDVYDSIQMNAVHGGKAIGRLALYRTRKEGLFTDQDAFYLRALSNHINLAYSVCSRSQRERGTAARDLDQLAREFNLTRREEEILGLVFQDMNNEEVLQQLTISRNTLLKHLQNLYRKCGVTSRLDLLKLRG